MPIDKKLAREQLESDFAAAEVAALAGSDSPPPSPDLASAFDSVFASETQAYREVLLGCVNTN